MVDRVTGAPVLDGTIAHFDCGSKPNITPGRTRSSSAACWRARREPVLRSATMKAGSATSIWRKRDSRNLPRRTARLQRNDRRRRSDPRSDRCRRRRRCRRRARRLKRAVCARGISCTRTRTSIISPTSGGCANPRARGLTPSRRSAALSRSDAIGQAVRAAGDPRRRRSRRRFARRRALTSGDVTCEVFIRPDTRPAASASPSKAPERRDSSPATRSSPAQSAVGISAARRWKTSSRRFMAS